MDSKTNTWHKAPPHSTEAEQTVLGALLIDSDKMLDVRPMLAPDDFYDPVHRVIYAAMLTLYEQRKPIDVVTLNDALRENEKVGAIGGSAFIANLATEVPTSAHAVNYAEIVREKSLRRQLVSLGHELAATAMADNKSAAELSEFAEQKVLALSHHSSDVKPRYLADLTDETYERYTQLFEAEDGSALFGINTGFAKLDLKLAGLQPGNFMIVAARPSMGKTSLALDIARHVAANQKKNVAFFSLEMTKQELMDRLIAGSLGVETWKLKQGRITKGEFQQLGEVFDRIAEFPIAIDDDPDTRLANLRSKARRHQLERGLDLLIIDYLQLIEVTDRAAGENRTQQVTAISKSLKSLARELQCPVIALSQLSRSCEQRHPAIPQLSDIRESGAIEQDADSVVMLYREGFYNPDCDDPDCTDLYLRKNRNGPTGNFQLRFNAKRMTFEEVKNRADQGPHLPPHQTPHLTAGLTA